MFPQHMQDEKVQLADGRTGTIEFVNFDYYTRQWGYWVRVPGDLVATYEDGLEATADDHSA